MSFVKLKYLSINVDLSHGCLDPVHGLLQSVQRHADLGLESVYSGLQLGHCLRDLGHGRLGDRIIGQHLKKNLIYFVFREDRFRLRIN